MKRVLRKKYSEDQINIVRNCLSEIEAWKDRYMYLDDDEIEDKIGEQLDNIYDEYRSFAASHSILTETEFNEIFEDMLLSESI